MRETFLPQIYGAFVSRVMPSYGRMKIMKLCLRVTKHYCFSPTGIRLVLSIKMKLVATHSLLIVTGLLRLVAF